MFLNEKYRIKIKILFLVATLFLPLRMKFLFVVGDTSGVLLNIIILLILQ